LNSSYTPEPGRTLLFAIAGTCTGGGGNSFSKGCNGTSSTVFVLLLANNTKNKAAASNATPPTMQPIAIPAFAPSERLPDEEEIVLVGEVRGAIY